ncbi:hypothetical protein K474DRAFT_1679490 [Panus rudis PR-1116 ss-1]|nr:hypothetical protein K474DRAFT_1679490 [Panus rudis PR-1116 ss-1]
MWINILNIRSMVDLLKLDVMVSESLRGYELRRGFCESNQEDVLPSHKSMRSSSSSSALGPTLRTHDSLALVTSSALTAQAFNVHARYEPVNSMSRDVIVKERSLAVTFQKSKNPMHAEPGWKISTWTHLALIESNRVDGSTRRPSDGRQSGHINPERLGDSDINSDSPFVFLCRLDDDDSQVLKY